MTVANVIDGFYFYNGSFAYLTTRKYANRYLIETRAVRHRIDGDLYILDEPYGIPL